MYQNFTSLDRKPTVIYPRQPTPLKGRGPDHGPVGQTLRRAHPPVRPIRPRIERTEDADRGRRSRDRGRRRRGLRAGRGHGRGRARVREAEEDIAKKRANGGEVAIQSSEVKSPQTPPEKSEPALEAMIFRHFEIVKMRELH